MRERCARTGTAAVGLLAFLALAAPAAAPAQQTQPLGPWNGENPFNCQIQNVGTGVDYPDPGADPFCVEFDKTSQNVLPDAGLVDFLANEPTRVAAAAPKCFYFQRDHWTGSVVQGQPPELWNWDGSYFFDKARGIGGVHVENFRTGGQPADFRPYAPPQYQPYLADGGGGGVILLMESDPDPTCVAKAEAGGVYNEPLFSTCVSPGGEIQGAQVGHVRLGMTRGHVHAMLGPPQSEKNGTDRWCVTGDGELRLGYAGGGRQGGGQKVDVILTTVLGHVLKGVRAGSRKRRAVNRLNLDRAFRAGAVRVYAGARRKGRRVLVGVGRKQVKWLALADPRALRSQRALKRAVREVAT